MFTGIIESIGEVVGLQDKRGDLWLRIKNSELDWRACELGDSIACNGVCLTAIRLHEDGFEADVSVETKNLTTVSTWATGSKMNLEMALRASARLGGHIVSGHVDGIGVVQNVQQDARSWRYVFSVPKELTKYIAKKGSICIDGVSLTVNGIQANQFDVNIVPHTYQHTCFSEYKIGTKVNLEVDLIARYLERLLLDQSDNVEGGVTAALLSTHGFIK